MRRFSVFLIPMLPPRPWCERVEPRADFLFKEFFLALAGLNFCEGRRQFIYALLRVFAEQFLPFATSGIVRECDMRLVSGKLSLYGLRKVMPQISHLHLVDFDGGGFTISQG
ncbi:MAG: hypothetical protein WAO35_22635 [Terriglobia bacterium]